MRKPIYEGMTGAEQMRTAVKSLNGCRESFLDRFTAEELLLLWRALCRSEWHIIPDEWTKEEIDAALAGTGNGATDEGSAKRYL